MIVEDDESSDQEIVEMAWQRIKEKKYLNVNKAVGSVFRSIDEVEDLHDLMTPFVRGALFQGVCGGRIRYVTYEKPYFGLVHYFERAHRLKISDDLALRVTSDLKVFSTRKNARDMVDLSDYNLPSVPYSALIHDIDVLLVNKSTTSNIDYLQFAGPLSGTQFDFIFISPAVVAGFVDRNVEMKIFEESVGIRI